MLNERNSTVIWIGQPGNWTKKVNNGIKAVLFGLIWFYQLHLSNLLGGNCRFYPSCSNYAVDVVKEQSFFWAIYLIFKRLIRCHPFGKSGYDPAPCKEKIK